MTSRKPNGWDRKDGWVRQGSFDYTHEDEEQEREEKKMLIRKTSSNDETKSCWEMLLECLTGSKSNRGGGYMSGDVTIEDLRSFLDSNPEIKNILLNNQCPLNPSEEMKTNIQTFMTMLESYGKETTIAQIYVRGGRKRRGKKTKKPKRRRTRRTRKH
jgi:hypothetical protein